MPQPTEDPIAERFRRDTAKAEMATVKATNLEPFTWLADGALIMRLSFRKDWVYARVLKNGHTRRRRYRPDQLVKVESAAPVNQAPTKASS